MTRRTIPARAPTSSQDNGKRADGPDLDKAPETSCYTSCFGVTDFQDVEPLRAALPPDAFVFEVSRANDPAVSDQFRRLVVVVLVHKGDSREIEAAGRLAMRNEGYARSVKVVEIPGWDDAEPLSEWLARRRPGLGTRGALAAWLHEREGVSPVLPVLPAPSPQRRGTPVGVLPVLPGTAPHVSEKSQGGFAGFAGSSSQVSEKIATPTGGGPPEFKDKPRDLIVHLLDVPALDVRLVPSRFQAWLLDHAERTNLPIDYAAVSALVALGALASRKLAICPKQYDDWTVVPNLWGGIVGPPGILKSEGRSEGQRFLRKLQAKAALAHVELLKTYERDILICAARAKAAKDQLEKAAKKTSVNPIELEDLATKAQQGHSQDPPPPPHYFLADSTYEALVGVLPSNPGVLIDRDELAGFLQMMEREGHQNDRKFYLESWDGLSPYNSLRVGRGYLPVPRNCVGIFGTIQPGPLARYVRDATSNGADNDGFLQRFQLLVYPNPPEKYVNVDRLPDSQARQAVESIFERLDEFDPATSDLEKHEDDTKGLYCVRFDPEAQEFFNEWRTDLENRILTPGPSALLLAMLGKRRSLMPALALLFHIIETAPDRITKEVSLDNATMAAAWCDYLEEHAKRIYATAVDGDIEPAKLLGSRLAKLTNPFAYRDVAKKGWSGLDTTEGIRRAVGILEEHGWVQVEEIPTGVFGGRPSEKVWIHPDLLPKPQTEEGAK